MKLTSLQDVVLVLKDASVRDSLPGCERLQLTPPATYSARKCSFSVIRRLKTWLRTTMGQERPSQAAVLASYPRRLDELDTEAEMRRFAADTTQRANAFGRW